jgi:hypothetical protein
MLGAARDRRATAMTEDREIERRRLLVERLAERLSRHVVGIFRERRQGRPELHGSGFLVSSSAGSFLISAAHVLDPLQSGTKLFFYPGPDVIRTLAGCVRVTNPPQGTDRKTDRYDVGVLRLLEPTSPPGGPIDKTALRLSALMPRASASSREGVSCDRLPGLEEQTSSRSPRGRGCLLRQLVPFCFRAGVRKNGSLN